MLAIGRDNVRGVEFEAERILAGVTCNALLLEATNWSSTHVYSFPVNLEPRYTRFTGDRIFAKTSSVRQGIGQRLINRPSDRILVKLHYTPVQHAQWNGLENGLRSQSVFNEQVCFEVVGEEGTVGVFLSGSKTSVGSLLSHWQTITSVTEEHVVVDPFTTIADAPSDALRFAELSTPGPYHYALTRAGEFSCAPLNILLSLMADIKSGEIAFCQVMFVAVANDWMANMRAMVAADGMLGKRSQFSQHHGASKVNDGKPLFAVKVRLGAVSRRAYLMDSLLSYAGLFQWGGASLNIRREDEFLKTLGEAKVRRMLRRRTSHTCGTLLHSAELMTFVVHLPDESIGNRPSVKCDTLEGFTVPARLKEHGVPLGINRYGGVMSTVHIPPSCRNLSTYMIGSTTAGKSVSIEHQALWYLRHGFATVLVDFHGDTADAILGRVPKELQEKTTVLDPGDQNFIPKFNPFCVNDPCDIGPLANDYVESMRGMFPNSWGPRLNHILVHEVAGLFVLRENLATLLDLCGSGARGQRLIRQIIETSTNSEIVRFFRDEYRTYPQDAFSPIINKVSAMLLDDRMRRMFSVTENAFDIGTMMESGLLVIKLSVGILGADTSAWFGDMVMAQIQKAAMRRATVPPDARKPVIVFADEIHRLKNLAVCHSIINECRKYKLYLTASHQETAQLSEEDFRAFTSVGNIMVFRVNVDDAKRMARAFNGQVLPEQIMNLGVGQVYARLDNNIVDFTTFPPEPGDPQVADAIYARSRALHYIPWSKTDADPKPERIKRERIFDTF